MAIPASYQDFSSGLDTKDAPYILDEGLGPLPARDVLNVQATTAGAIVKRQGLVTFASPASAAQSLFASEATPSLYLVASVSTTLVSIQTNGTVTSIKTGVTNNARWEFISAPVVSGQGPVYGMNGTDTPQQWSGATAATATANWTNASGAVSVPNGKYCIYKNNHVFVSGVSATPSRVFWSATADPTNWDPASLTGAGFADFDPNDGQAITGIGTIGPYVLVFKPRKTWVIVDTGTAATRKVSDQVGCVAHRSIQEGAEGTYFLSEDRGVFLTNGSTIAPISDKIFPSLTTASPSLAAGGYFNGHYYLSLPINTGSNDTTFDYDATLKSWWKHSFGSNQMTVWHPAGTANFYSAKPQSGIIDQAFVSNTYTDNGSAMTWVWRGPWQSPSFYRRRLFPTPYYRKRLRQVRFDGFGTVDFSLAKDFAPAETLIKQNALAGPANKNFGGSGTFGTDSGAFGGGATLQRNRAYSLGVADAFSMVFGSTSTTQDAVTSFLLHLHDRVDGLGGS